MRRMTLLIGEMMGVVFRICGGEFWENSRWRSEAGKTRQITARASSAQPQRNSNRTHCSSASHCNSLEMVLCNGKIFFCSLQTSFGLLFPLVKELRAGLGVGGWSGGG
jgi:hypothetical protein